VAFNVIGGETPLVYATDAAAEPKVKIVGKLPRRDPIRRPSIHRGGEGGNTDEAARVLVFLQGERARRKGAIARSMETRSSGPSSKRLVRKTASPSTRCRPKAPSPTGPSNALKDHGDTSSTAVMICRIGSLASTNTLTPSPTFTTSIDRMAHSTAEPQPSISKPSAKDRLQNLMLP